MNRFFPEPSRKIGFALLGLSIFLTQVTLYEMTLVTDTERVVLYLKLAVSLAFFPCLGWARLRPQSQALKLIVGGLMVVYPLLGSLTRPWYVLSALELSFCYAFFFDVSPKLFFSVLTAQLTLFYASFISRWPNVPENSETLHLADWISISVQFSVLVALAYKFVYRFKLYQERSEANFISMGRYASRVTHDLKGFLSAPLLYLDHARVQLLADPSTPATLLHSLNETQRHLGELHLAVGELSRLTTTDALPSTRFLLSDCLHSTSLLFKQELSRLPSNLVELMDLKLMVETDRSLIASLAFEVFSLLLKLQGRSVSGHPTSFLRCSFDSDYTVLNFRLERDGARVLEPSMIANLQALAIEAGTPLSIRREPGALVVFWNVSVIAIG